MSFGLSFDFWFIFGFLGGVAFGWAGPMDGCVDWCVKQLERRLKTRGRPQQNGVARAVDKLYGVFDKNGNSIPVEVAPTSILNVSHPKSSYPEGTYCRAGCEVSSTPFPEEQYNPTLLTPPNIKPHNL